MSMPRRPRFALQVVAASALAAFACGAALAQQKPAGAGAYPAKQIRFVIPFPPGGSTDIVARIIQARLAERLGTQVLIDNRPGANTIIGTDIVAKAPPDGYTILMATSGHSINPSAYARLPFDVFRDFTPIVHATDSANLYAAHPSLPVRNGKDLVALARGRPGQLNYSSAGLGSVQHLSTELMNQVAKVSLVHVGYKGGAASTLAAMSGEVALVITGLPALISHVRGGKLKAVAVTSKERSSLLPDTATMVEAGYPALVTYYWLGVMGPAGLPAPIVERINAEVNAVMREPAVRERLVKEGGDPVGGTVQEFDAMWRAEHDRWARVVKSTGIRLEQ
jgi:tripartite-type tricarboxylate transporter receptor subunit TctC